MSLAALNQYRGRLASWLVHHYTAKGLSLLSELYQPRRVVHRRPV